MWPSAGLCFLASQNVWGFGINARRVEMLRRSEDPSRELDPESFENADTDFTPLSKYCVRLHFIVADNAGGWTQGAGPQTHFGRKWLPSAKSSKGDYVIYESTVYQAAPKRIFPSWDNLQVTRGDRLSNRLLFPRNELIRRQEQYHKQHPQDCIGQWYGRPSMVFHSAVYGSVIRAGVYEAPSHQSCQRRPKSSKTHSEISTSHLWMEALDHLWQDGYSDTQVIEAATKWNFLKFYPGLVNWTLHQRRPPIHLLIKSHELGYDPQVILSSRRVQWSDAEFIA